MIGGDPAFYLRWTLGSWGSNGLGHIEPEALAEYERCFCRADAIHATCEDYRAGASIDLEHDRASRTADEKIACDLYLLWGSRGLRRQALRPLALWRAPRRGQGRGRRDGGRALHPRGAARRHGAAPARLLPRRLGPAQAAFTLSTSPASRAGLPSRHARGGAPCSRGSTRLDHYFPIRYGAWALCIVGFLASMAGWMRMGFEPWLGDRLRRPGADRPARRDADAARDPAQLSGDRPPALPARVHPPGDPPVLHRGTIATPRRSRASSARSSTSAPRAIPTSGRSAPSSTSARSATNGSTTRCSPRC